MNDCCNYFEPINSFKKYSDIPSCLLYGEIPKKKPFLSIGIPTYKRPELLREAIESVMSQLQLEGCEIVVVDNEESDIETPAEQVVRELSCPILRYYRNEKNIGAGGNWNRLLELSEGEWVALLPDDDLLYPDYTKVIIDTLRRYPSLAFLGFRGDVLDEVGYFPEKQEPSALVRFFRSFRKNTGLFARKITLTDFLFDIPHNTTGLVVNREKALAQGGYNDEWYPCFDYILPAVLVHRFSGLLIEKPLGCYRLAENDCLRPGVMEMCAEEHIKYRRYFATQLRGLMSPLGRYFVSVVNYLNVVTATVFPLEFKNSLVEKYSIDKRSCFLHRVVLKLFLFTRKVCMLRYVRL